MVNKSDQVDVESLFKMYEALRVRLANSLLAAAELEILLSVEKNKNAELEKLLNTDLESKNKDNA
jgi:hypothetical protein